jgi:hypothetical protein
MTTFFTPRKQLTEKLPVPTESDPTLISAD